MDIHKKKMWVDVTRARRRKIHVQDFPRQRPDRRRLRRRRSGPKYCDFSIFMYFKSSHVGRKRTCVRHVGEAASQPIWASRRLRSRVRAVLGPENKSPGSY